LAHPDPTGLETYGTKTNIKFSIKYEGIKKKRRKLVKRPMAFIDLTW